MATETESRPRRGLLAGAIGVAGAALKQVTSSSSAFKGKSTGSSGTGLIGETSGSTGFGVNGFNTASSGTPVGVRGAASGSGIGVFGIAARGVVGESGSPTGIGVVGKSTATTGTGSATGVSGEADGVKHFGGHFQNRNNNGFALRVQGGLRLEGAGGVAHIAAGANSVVVTPPIPFRSTSFVVATLQSDPGGGRTVARVVIGVSSFTILLTGKAAADCTVGWMMAN